tara:strand:+ start:3195 stop:4808 length:1614 start_codon:yes stop_codon:yes gene_type:complete
MRTLVHIPRPNQGFHVGFAITCAFALSQLDLSSVDILICNDSDNYCPVKTYFDKTPVYGHCAECDSNTDYFLSLIKRFNSHNANKINVFYVKDFLDDANTFTSEMAQQELEEFSTRYRNHAKHLHLLNDPIDYTWLSELLSLNQISCQDIVDGNFCHETAIDLIKLSHRTRSIAKNFLHSRNYDKYIVYNARHTHARTFWRSLQSILPFCDCFIHEAGVRTDSFLLLANCSPEATFENLPLEIFPYGIPSSLINDFHVAACLDKPSTTDVINYFSDKLSGRRGFYQNRVVVSSPSKSLQLIKSNPKNPTILLLLASVDEVACPYPVDRVLFEHRLVPLMIKHLASLNYNILVKLHPRSNCQLTNKLYSNNSYKSFVNKVSKIADAYSSVHLFYPKSSESSYDLMALSDVAISLFSIAAVEAQALGTPAMVHARCRGSSFSSANINSLDVNNAFSQFKQILPVLITRSSDRQYRRDSAHHARTFLTKIYTQNELQLPGFRDFLPHVSFEWMKIVEQIITNPDYAKSELMYKLYSKLGF